MGCPVQRHRVRQKEVDDRAFQAWCDARAAERSAAREARRAAERSADEALFNPAPRQPRIHDVDRRVASLARGTTGPRLELGLLLHHMMERRWFIELGMPSFQAYATQRVSQGSRWANDARGLARTLHEKPGLSLVAGALEGGIISWSMAAVVAKYLQRFARRGVTDETQAGRSCAQSRLDAEQLEVLALIHGKTVRKAKLLLAQRLERHGGNGRPTVCCIEESSEDEEELRRFERTIPLHETWIVESGRLLLNALVHHHASDELFVDALIGEACASVGLRSEEDGETFRRLHGQAAVARKALETRRKDRAARNAVLESAAERRFGGLAEQAASAANESPRIEPMQWREPPDSARELDAEIRRLCAQLENVEMELCMALVDFDDRSGWRTLGFASRDQYARERLGITRQAAHELRARGRAFRDFPELFEAVGSRRICMSAVRLIAKVATPDTVEAWIERATQRTVVHLREEVDAVRMSVRCGLDVDLWPPNDQALAESAELERQVLSGEIWTPLHDALTDGVLADMEPAEGSVGMSVGDQPAITDSPGTTYRFMIPPAVALEFELAERVYQAMVPDTPDRPRPSFLAFACLALYAAHKDAIEASLEHDRWGHVYLRDRYKCQNPVCGSRSTVTPHHMQFQSHDGGDEAENMKTLCHVCHLAMVHDRRSLVVEPPASRARWLIGGDEAPLLEVVGRKVVRRAG